MARETTMLAGKAYWTKLNTPDKMSEKYQMDICNLSEETLQKLKKHGVKPKNKEDDREWFITAKSKFEVPIINHDKEGMNGTLIGNGSAVKVKITFNKDHPLISELGTSMYLNKVMVTNLIPYGNDDDFDDVEGVNEGVEGDEVPF